MAYYKGTKLSIVTREASQLRQCMPVVNQNTRYGLAVALANGPVIALSI